MSNSNKVIKNNNNKGLLSAWIVTNKGELYFRKNISHANIEGTTWLNIFLPKDNMGIATRCSCSCTGKLVVATNQGDFLVRLGITHEQPWGHEWLVVKKVIRQIKFLVY
jgi:hypothetical protein